MEKIHFIITGGTIDSYYDGTKDSRAITDEDRIAMANAIESSSATKFIITHGTYTMPDTARYLKQQLRGGVRPSS